MKKLIFMRHGYLEGKYKDYSRLDFNDLENLLVRKFSPEIDKEKTLFVMQSKEFLPKIKLIICSTESRSIKTAEIVKDLVGVDFNVSHLLNEIKFVKGAIEEEDIKDFKKLREKILTNLFYSNYSENFDEVKNRFLHFLDYVKNLDHDTILCITHGWFMRLIYIYSARNSLENISLKELLEARVPNFLDTIEVKIDD